jgi:hypothetical protein
LFFSFEIDRLVDWLECVDKRNRMYAHPSIANLQCHSNLFLFHHHSTVFPSAYVEAVDSAATFSAKVLYDFAGEHEGTLALHAGDVVTVCKAPDNGWWEGYFNGRWGLFPTQYVERVADNSATSSGSGSVAPRLPPDSNSVDAVPSTPGGDDDDASGKRSTLAKKDKKGRSGGTHKRITQEMIIRDDAAPSPSPTGTSDGGETKHRSDSRDAELKKREFELKEREAELAERESELAVGETALQKKQVKLKKRESEVSDQKQSLDDLERELNDRKEKLDDADEDVRKREAKLKKKESDVRDKKKEVEHKELELEKKQRDLQRRQKEVAFQAEELQQQTAAMAKASVSRETAREDALKRAEARLAQQNDEIARMQQELSEKEYVLQQRDAELTEREREIQEKSAALAARAAVARTGTVGGPRRTASAAPLSAVKIDPNLSPEARKQVLRQTVIEEIVATEADYVGDLELVVTHCLEPARQRGIISQQDLTRLFSNIEQIWRSNSAVLAQLVQRNDPTDSKVGMLGDVLEGMADTLRSYAGYCANHDASVAAYLKLKENPDSEKHLDELEKDLQGHDLCGFLIKPVQRLCKYPLLIRELSKYTDESHRDYAGLQRAEKAVGDAVQHVNDYQKRLEATARLAELQSEFIGVPAGFTIDSPDHTFLFEAVVTELVDAGSNTSEERSLFLFSDALLVAKPHTRQKLHAYKTHVPIGALRTKDLPVNPQVQHGLLVQSARPQVALMLNFANAARRRSFWRRPTTPSAMRRAAAWRRRRARRRGEQRRGEAGGAVERAERREARPEQAGAAAEPVARAVQGVHARQVRVRAVGERAAAQGDGDARHVAENAAPRSADARRPAAGAARHAAAGAPRRQRRRARRAAAAASSPRAPPAAPPSPPPEDGGSKKRLCRKCNERKAVAKVTLNDGTFARCATCVSRTLASAATSRRRRRQRPPRTAATSLCLCRPSAPARSRRAPRAAWSRHPAPPSPPPLAATPRAVAPARRRLRRCRCRSSRRRRPISIAPPPPVPPPDAADHAVAARLARDDRRRRSCILLSREDERDDVGSAVGAATSSAAAATDTGALPSMLPPPIVGAGGTAMLVAARFVGRRRRAGDRQCWHQRDDESIVKSG